MSDLFTQIQQGEIPIFQHGIGLELKYQEVNTKYTPYERLVFCEQRIRALEEQIKIILKYVFNSSFDFTPPRGYG